MFKQYAEQLVAEGKAYYCFCTEERLEALHAEQRAQGEMTHYDGCCRDLPQEEVRRRLEAGEPYVIRQKIPRTGVTGFDDLVYGHIEVNNSLYAQVQPAVSGVWLADPGVYPLPAGDEGCTA